MIGWAPARGERVRLRLLFIALDDATVVELSHSLVGAGHAVVEGRVSSAEELALVEPAHWDLALGEQRCGALGIAGIVAGLRRGERELPFVLVARDASGALAREAFLAGARDALSWPNDEPRLAGAVQREISSARRDLALHLAEDSRRGSDLGYRHLFEAASDAILLLEGRRIVDCNPRALEVFARRKDALVGASIEMLSPTLQRDGTSSSEAADRVGRMLIEEGASLFEWRHSRPDGTVFDVEVCVGAAPSARPHTWVAIVRDVTEARAHESLTRQSRALEAAQRLAGSVAHDYNNLLVAIFGHLELAMDGLEPGSSLEEEVRGAHGAAESVAALTRKLQLLGRRPPVANELVDLRAVIDEALPALRAQLDSAVRLVHEVSREGEFLVVGDRQQLGSVVSILVRHAGLELGGGGCVRVVLAREQLPAPALRLSVRDDGPGLDAASLERIFEPYALPSQRAAGTGLELALAHQIVSQHEGTIHAESEPGQGSALHVLLPAAKGAELRPAAPLTKESRSPGVETILLAEDDELVRSLTARALEREGYHVLAAQDGAEAIEIYNARGHEVDAAVLDIVMPRASGLDVYETIARQRPDFAALFASGYNEEHERIAALESPAVRYLQKPYRMTELLGALRQVLEARREEAER